MTTSAGQITGGVDTHLDVHVAAALDERGALLVLRDHTEGLRPVAGLAGELLGSVELLGVEGTGSYGAGLTRSPARARHSGGRGRPPNRQRRRRHGKCRPRRRHLGRPGRGVSLPALNGRGAI